jgi:hypothetical protein
MILLAHPFGNANVRAVLEALHARDLLAKYVTALGWSEQAAILRFLPANVRRSLARRSYRLPPKKIAVHPAREALRLSASAAKIARLTEHERGFASIDRVWSELDAAAARHLRVHRQTEKVTAVYATKTARSSSSRRRGTLMSGASTISRSHIGRLRNGC